VTTEKIPRANSKIKQ